MTDKPYVPMSRTDHAARAEELLTEEGRYQFAKIDALAEALTHATLALVEQQRIANLIALAMEDLTGIGRLAREALAERSGDRWQFRPDTAAALGIEVQS